MRKLRVGRQIEHLGGVPALIVQCPECGTVQGPRNRFGERRKKCSVCEAEVSDPRPKLVRDCLVELIGGLQEKDRDKRRILKDIGDRLYNYQEEWFELENSEFRILKRAIENQASEIYTLVVVTVLDEVFEEADRIYEKRDDRNA